eukprot:m.39575 g.39575  ORF g.39575 m.39575 type:complete len:104 (+) comp7977_c0_seq1:773-1084(+)
MMRRTTTTTTTMIGIHRVMVDALSWLPCRDNVSDSPLTGYTRSKVVFSVVEIQGSTRPRESLASLPNEYGGFLQFDIPICPKPVARLVTSTISAGLCHESLNL